MTTSDLPSGDIRLRYSFRSQLVNKTAERALQFIKELTVANMKIADQKAFRDKDGKVLYDKITTSMAAKTVNNISKDPWATGNGVENNELSKFFKDNGKYLAGLAKSNLIDSANFETLKIDVNVLTDIAPKYTGDYAYLGNPELVRYGGGASIQATRYDRFGNFKAKS